MNKKELLNHVDSLELPKTEYCILSGGSLLMYGLREQTNDLDIDITNKGFDLIKNKFCPILMDDSSKRYKLTDNIECFLVQNLESDIDFVDGYPCQSLVSVLKFKQKLNREKDQKDIIAIKNFLKI